ncbi:MAG: hypothetical protein IIU83_01615 [Fibrobacteraceae bacterium]|nr:hypothetical protein [Fibrobacteraceae bacterium]
MKNLLKKFEIEGLLAILALAFACISMWGCMGCSDEKVIDSGISVGNHFYMVDDSTIMLDFFIGKRLNSIHRIFRDETKNFV